MKRRQDGKPPDPLFRAKSCTGKKRYNSEAAAAAMIGIQQVYGEDLKDVCPYRCVFCNRWHLGHKMEG